MLTSETLQEVLGSGENGVKRYSEQGAWDKKNREQGAKESNFVTVRGLSAKLMC